MSAATNLFNIGDIIKSKELHSNDKQILRFIYYRPSNVTLISIYASASSTIIRIDICRLFGRRNPRFYFALCPSCFNPKKKFWAFTRWIYIYTPTNTSILWIQTMCNSPAVYTVLSVFKSAASVNVMCKQKSFIKDMFVVVHGFLSKDMSIRH